MVFFEKLWCCNFMRLRLVKWVWFFCIELKGMILFGIVVMLLIKVCCLIW